MLDGRVKTLHPRVHGGLLAEVAGSTTIDARLIAAAMAVRAGGREPVSVRRSRAARSSRSTSWSKSTSAGRRRSARPPRTTNVIVVSPARYAAVLDALDDPAASRCAPSGAGAKSIAARRPMTPGPTAELPLRFAAAAGLDLPPSRCLPGATRTPTLTVTLEKVETLRYGENPHQPAARYRRPGTTSADGPFGCNRRALLQQRPRCSARVRAGSGVAWAGGGHREAREPVRGRGAVDPRRSVVRGPRGPPTSARSAAWSR